MGELQHGDVTARTHLSLKLLMIVIVQVMYFDGIMSTLRHILFLVNPVALVELHTDWEEHCEGMPNEGLFHKVRRAVYTRKIFLLPPAFIAMVLRLVIIWIVIVDSISIILVSREVTDTIWDCL